MKLKLEHLAPYLPHNIEFLDNGKPETIIGWKGDRIYIDDCHKSGYCSIDEVYTLLLRPLSDLTKEVEIYGKRFIPLLELAALAGTCSASDWHIKGDIAYHNTVKECSFAIAYDNSFIFRNSEKWKDFGVPSQQFRMFNLLFEWHFDMFKLIENGLAVNVHCQTSSPIENGSVALAGK